MSNKFAMILILSVVAAGCGEKSSRIYPSPPTSNFRWVSSPDVDTLYLGEVIVIPTKPLLAGGNPRYRFEVLSGALPAGLTLDLYGAIRGIPTALGDVPCTIKATDAVNNVATTPATFRVRSR